MADLVIAHRLFAAWTDLETPKLRKGATAKEIADGPKYTLTSLVEHADIKTDWFKAISAAVDAEAIKRFGKPAYEEMLDENGFDSPFDRKVGSKGFDKDRFKFIISSAARRDYPPAIKLRDGSLMPRPFVDDEGRPQFYFGVELRASFSVRVYGGLTTGYTPGAKLDLRTVQKVRNHPILIRAGGADGKELGALPAEDETSLGALAE